MMKLLHSADWHLDSPLSGRTEAQAAQLRAALLALPGQVAAAVQAQQAALVLLSGDLFDGAYTPDSLHAVQSALEAMRVPVFIAPGNHDPAGPESPWEAERWPGNVHIFRSPEWTSVALPEFGCRIYGAAFSPTGSIPAQLAAGAEEPITIGVLHGDPTQRDSCYRPITAAEVAASGLTYLALGHIHKRGAFHAGNTLCAWPGSPIGRGYDELGARGLLTVTIGESANAEFLPLDTPRFYDLEAEAEPDAGSALAALLPPAGNRHFYRVTLTGVCPAFDTDALAARFPQFPNLEVRDCTMRPEALFGSAGQDTLEGVYFGLLHSALDGADAAQRARILLAARISRRILNGQEVVLP